jgi:hypothetical protein
MAQHVGHVGDPGAAEHGQGDQLLVVHGPGLVGRERAALGPQ